MHNDYVRRLGRRRLSRRGLLGGFAATSIGAAGLALVGCGDDDDGGGGSTLERAQDTGRIRIGFANEAPYGFADSGGNVTGEAPTVAKAVLEEMGITEIDAIVRPFGELIAGLEAGRYDIIAAGMFINPGRCENILFSDPDYCVPQAFLVEPGNPEGIMTFEDIAANPDITVAIPTGAVEETYLIDAGGSEDQILSVPAIQDAGDALAAGRAQAVAATSLAVEAENERLGGDFEVTPGFEVTIDGEPASGCGGYGFRTDDEDLRNAFNDVLISMKENNEIRPLVEEFGFDDEVEAAKGRTADQLCAE